MNKETIFKRGEQLSADLNNTFERLEKGDVKYRFVIDMADLKK